MLRRLLRCGWVALTGACGGHMDAEPATYNHPNSAGSSSMTNWATVGGGAMIAQGGATAPDATGGTADPPPWAYCGNGTHNYDEECDDGNAIGGDGCSALCVIESDFVCVEPGAPCRRQSVCGNGKLDVFEICDDGNQTDGDGCSSDCQTVSAGWVCFSPGQGCWPRCGDGLMTASGECDLIGHFCGDGFVDSAFGEQCDPGSPGPSVYGQSACSAVCQLAHFCGDGLLDSLFDEQCEPPDTALHRGVYCDRDCHLALLDW